MKISDNVDNNMKRPTMNDPKEFAIIRKVYLNHQTFRSTDLQDLDPVERFDRLNKKLHINNKSSR